MAALLAARPGVRVDVVGARRLPLLAGNGELEATATQIAVATAVVHGRD